MGRINRKKLLDRQHDRRDARLFVIATEGEKTEKQYFEMFGNSKIKVEILETVDRDSAPQFVLERLDSFKDRFDLSDEDMLWLVIDVDQWYKHKHLIYVCREAKQKNYNLAVSNPCFEVWLNFHFEDLNPADIACSDFGKRLREILGSYNKSNLDLSLYSQSNIEDAINRAKSLHPNHQQHWPPTIGSHVYRLVEILLQISNPL
jgi:RloB-like protein